MPPLRKLLHLLQAYIPDLHSGNGMVNNHLINGILREFHLLVSKLKSTAYARNQRARARNSGDVTPIYIVANGNDNVMINFK